MWCDMMGQGGGRAGGVAETGEYFLRRWWCMFGQGGGREFLIEKIGVGVGKIGQGGGHCFAVVPAGVCVPWWCLLHFLFGHGCGRNREVR